MSPYEQLEAVFAQRFSPESPLRELKLDPEVPEAVYRIDPQWASEHAVTPEAVEEFFATHLQVPAADYCHYDPATGLVTLWDAPEEWRATAALMASGVLDDLDDLEAFVEAGYPESE